MFAHFYDAKLNELSSQIKGLLDSDNEIFEEVKATLIGAFYSISMALQHGYTDDLHKGISDDYLTNIVNNYKDLHDEKWKAGYYFNSGLYRLSAAYHRALKIYTNSIESRDHVSKLLKKAKEMGRETDVTNLDIIRTQVNFLKHEVFGLTKGERPAIDNVLKSFNELLFILERG